MRKTLNNRRYDTDTAHEVGEWTNGIESVNDFDYLSRTLYRKRNGEYFVHELSGLNGESITPLPIDDVRGWAEHNLDAADYDREFGDPPEGERAQVTLTISQTAYDTLKTNAARDSSTMSALVEGFALNL